MKQIKFLSVLVLFCATTFAQYKKASFFNKDGRTLELGTSLAFIPNGAGRPALCFNYTTSIESAKKISPYSELEFMPRMRFSFDGIGFSSTTGSYVSGKFTGTSPVYLLTRYGLQYRFANAESGNEAKLVPYVKAGLGVGYGIGLNYSLRDNNGNIISSDDTEPSVPEHELSFIAEPGAGATYYFTKKTGIKVGLSYMHVMQLIKNGNSQIEFFPFRSHVKLNVSFKYRIFSED